MMTTSQLEAVALALVVFGAEAAVGIEHAGADLDLCALHAALAAEVVDAPAVVQRDALGPSFFDLEVVGRHLFAGLEADLVDGRSAEAARGARRVDGDVAAADDQHALAGDIDGLSELDGAQEARARSGRRRAPRRARAGSTDLCVPVATRTASKPSSLSAATSSTFLLVSISTPIAVTLAMSSSTTSFGRRYAGMPRRSMPPGCGADSKILTP